MDVKLLVAKENTGDWDYIVVSWIEAWPLTELTPEQRQPPKLLIFGRKREWLIHKL